MDAEDMDADMDAGMHGDVDADADVDADVNVMEGGRPSVAAVASAPVPGPAAVAEMVEMAVPELEPTGHAEVDAALDRLRLLSERPTGAHPDLYDGVHQRLQEVLAQIDHHDAGR